MTELFDLTGKTALVTGGAGGIGKSQALGLADAGADVAVASRNLGHLEDVAKEIAAKGRKSLAVTADVVDEKSAAEMVDKVIKELGRIDILVCSHGLAIRQPADTFAVEEWRQRTRYILRHLNDPIALQRSPVCRLSTVERISRLKYPSGVVARGRTLHDITQECLQEIEAELEGHTRIHKFKTFITLTRQGNGVSAASRKIGISTEYDCRSFKKELINLLAEKLITKLH